MCPKSKPTETVLHRLELQTAERDVLEMVAASITARNVTASAENLTKGVGNLITPILGASVAGVGVALGLLSYYELYVVPNNKIATPKGILDGILDLFRTAEKMEERILRSEKEAQKKTEAFGEEARAVGEEARAIGEDRHQQWRSRREGSPTRRTALKRTPTDL